MADQIEYDWNTVPVPAETITEADQASSNNLSMEKPVGTFLCVVTKCTAVQNDMKAYSCIAAQLDLTIEKVFRLDQPLVDNMGTPIMKNGQEILRPLPVPPEKIAEVEGVMAGLSITERINLFSPEEKPGTKNRRLFIAKEFGLIDNKSVELPPQKWMEAPGKKIIITTERQTYKDKMTDEMRSIVKVKWDGFETVNNLHKYVQAEPTPPPANDADKYMDQTQAPAPDDNDSFDI